MTGPFFDYKEILTQKPALIRAGLNYHLNNNG